MSTDTEPGRRDDEGPDSDYFIPPRLFRSMNVPPAICEQFGLGTDGRRAGPTTEGDQK